MIIRSCHLVLESHVHSCVSAIIWYETVTEKAHDLTDRPRTDDVVIEDNVNFSDFLLSEATLKGLTAGGFLKPSPIQRKAIPLGKCGFDLIAQAKSGTGKTCVFTVVALEMVQVELEKLQVLILSPTREISVQIRDVISSIGRFLGKLKVEAFIGGLPLEKDKKKLKKCQIAVGAPGRIKHLITGGLMNVDAVRLFVLDEADKLMEDSFRQDISLIYLRLPDVKQMIAASATFPPQLEEFVTRYMTNPMRVSPGKETFLIGIRQFVSVIPSHNSVFVQMKKKLTELCRILSMISFKQCLVFSNYQSRAESICNELNKAGWSAIYINGSQNQMARLKAMRSLKDFRCRILLSTDLTSRGIDAENVNLIINLDLPYDGATYMHRIGRAGRYGTYGLAITIVQSGSELDQFRKMLNEMGCQDFKVSLLPEGKLKCNIWEAEDEDFDKISAINRELGSLTVVDSETNAGQPKCRGEEEEIENKGLSELFACHFTLPEKPRLNEYDELLEAALEFQRPDDFEIPDGENKLYFEDFSSALKSSVILLEEKGWERHRKKLDCCNEVLENKEEKLGPPEIIRGENEENSEHEVGEVSNVFSNYFESTEEDEDEELEAGREEIEVEGEGEEVEEEEEEEEEVEEEEEEEEEEEDADDEAGNFDYVTEGSSEGHSDCESEGSELRTIGDSFYINQWYSMWYSQLNEIRHYINYLKYFHYWNEMHHHR